MGDNFLRQQAGNFTKKRDKAILELDTPKLFRRSEVVDTIYTVLPVAGEELSLGYHLVLLQSNQTECVSVVRGNKQIGTISGPGGKILAAALHDVETAGTAEIQITDVAPLSRTGKARLVRRQCQNEKAR